VLFANLLGAAGVVASLIYLGIQVRQNTRTARARAFQDIFAGFTAQNLEMFGPANIDLIIAGMRDFSRLRATAAMAEPTGYASGPRPWRTRS
jgi:hypothetical protein